MNGLKIKWNNKVTLADVIPKYFEDCELFYNVFKLYVQFISVGIKYTKLNMNIPIIQLLKAFNIRFINISCQIKLFHFTFLIKYVNTIETKIMINPMKPHYKVTTKPLNEFNIVILMNLNLINGKHLLLHC